MTDISSIADDHPGLQWHRIAEAIQCLRARRDEASAICDIASRTLPLLEEIRDHLDDQRRVNKAIARVDVLRSQMDTFGRCYDLITQLTQFTELQRFERDRKLAASKASGADRQRRQVERDIDNVKSVIDASRQFQSLLADVIDRLSAEHAATGELLAQKEAA
jgi:hypothetical protein